MLPDITRQERVLPVRERCVRVGGLDDLQRIAFLHQPGPAASELCHSRVTEGGLEGLEAPERRYDPLGQFACRNTPAIGFHALPEERVVPDLGGIVENSSLFRLARCLADDLFQRQTSELLANREFVQVVHVGLMVFSIVEAHRPCRNIRL